MHPTNNQTNAHTPLNALDPQNPPPIPQRRPLRRIRTSPNLATRITLLAANLARPHSNAPAWHLNHRITANPHLRDRRRALVLAARITTNA